MIMPMTNAPKITRDADLLGDVRRQQHAGEDRRDPAAGHAPGLVVTRSRRAPSSGRTRSAITRQKATARRDRPDHVAAGPATATAVASAIRNQAVTSSIAAQASASAPTGRLSIRRSTRMRASTGNAVIDIATPMNSAKATNFVSGPTSV